MSTAVAFVFPGSFPFCVTNISGVVNGAASYLDNLTLAQAMGFAWNIETFTLDTTGTATVGSDTATGTMTFTLSPIASGLMSYAALNDGSMWFGAALTRRIFSSWPAVRVPVARICQPSMTVNGTLVDLNSDDNNAGTYRAENEIGFWVGTDPNNAGKYRLYYRILVKARDPATATVEILWDNRSSVSGLTSITNGTITIGGLTFAYYSYKTTGASHTGGTMSASSTSFTY